MCDALHAAGPAARTWPSWASIAPDLIANSVSKDGENFCNKFILPCECGIFGYDMMLATMYAKDCPTSRKLTMRVVDPVVSPIPPSGSWPLSANFVDHSVYREVLNNVPEDPGSTVLRWYSRAERPADKGWCLVGYRDSKRWILVFPLSLCTLDPPRLFTMTAGFLRLGNEVRANPR